MRRPTPPLCVRGFTLLEVLAVVALVSLVLVVAVDFYLDLSRATREAAESTRDARRAAAIIDRVARDIQSAVLLEKPPEVDPLEHPWLFLAEGGDSTVGAERIKFVSRGHRPRSTQALESDLEVVAWMVAENEEGGQELLRWSSPRLPDKLDRTFPRASDEGALVVAEGIESFGVRLLAEDGSWKSNWDSSTLTESNQLPLSADITLRFAHDGDGEKGTGASYHRQVLVPLRPLEIDLLEAPGGVAGFVARSAQQGNGEEGDEDGGANAGGDEDETGLARAEDEEDEDENCVTVGECFQRHPEALSAIPDVALPSTVFDSIANECWSRYEPILRQTDFFRKFGVDLSDCR